MIATLSVVAYVAVAVWFLPIFYRRFYRFYRSEFRNLPYGDVDRFAGLLISVLGGAMWPLVLLAVAARPGMRALLVRFEADQ